MEIISVITKISGVVRSFQRFVQVVQDKIKGGLTRDEFFELLAALLLVIGDSLDIVVPVPESLEEEERGLIAGFKQLF